MYTQYLNDPLDQDYVLQLLNILITSIESKNILINEVSLPFPDESIGILIKLFFILHQFVNDSKFHVFLKN